LSESTPEKKAQQSLCQELALLLSIKTRRYVERCAPFFSPMRKAISKSSAVQILRALVMKDGLALNDQIEASWRTEKEWT
jgi:hypothetical protein